MTALLPEQATKISREHVCAVVVSYQPDLEQLKQLLDAVALQVGGTILFDNGSTVDGFDALARAAEANGFRVVRHSCNEGLAAGMNHGIDLARAAGFRFVLLLDQDSLPEPGMMDALAEAYCELSLRTRVAAVGAQFVDPRDGQVAPFVRVGFPFNRKLQGGAGQRVEADFLISSGSLLPMEVIDVVGGMDESLFIDSVDLDWSFRARAAGYALYGICGARMRHSIGDALKPGLFGRKVFVHGPTRLYYLMRNRVLLYRRAHTPAVWVAQDVLRFVGKFVRMSMFVSPRRANARAMLRGLWDGIRGRAGKLAP